MCAVTKFLAILALIECVICGETAIHQRFEYQFGFKGPLLAQKDGLIPFWEHGGRKCFLNTCQKYKNVFRFIITAIICNASLIDK